MRHIFLFHHAYLSKFSTNLPKSFSFLESEAEKMPGLPENERRCEIIAG